MINWGSNRAPYKSCLLGICCQFLGQFAAPKYDCMMVQVIWSLMTNIFLIKHFFSSRKAFSLEEIPQNKKRSSIHAEFNQRGFVVVKKKIFHSSKKRDQNCRSDRAPLILWSYLTNLGRSSNQATNEHCGGITLIAKCKRPGRKREDPFWYRSGWTNFSHFLYRCIKY